MVREDHHEHVLFECTTEALCASLLGALNDGGWVAAPLQSQGEIRRVWSSFHADARRYLTPGRTDGGARRVVALVEGRSPADLQVTLESLAATGAVRHVVVLNRSGMGLPPTAGEFSIRNIDLSIEEPGALDEEIAKLADEAVLMIHSGIRVRAHSFAGMLSALDGAGIDGLQPAAEVVGDGQARRIVLPLGGDPSFALFEGATFTGGLLVRGEAFRRARLWRDFAVDSAFMGLAEFCMTRGIEVWPYPEPVFERPEDWTAAAARPLPTLVKAFDDCSPADRYYMLAVGYGTAGRGAGASERAGRQRLAAMALIDLGLLPLVRLASWARRRARDVRPRLSLGPIERRLERLLRGDG